MVPSEVGKLRWPVQEPSYTKVCGASGRDAVDNIQLQVGRAQDLVASVGVVAAPNSCCWFFCHFWAAALSVLDGCLALASTAKCHLTWQIELSG